MLTEKKDLRTGTPVWDSYPVPRIPFTELKSDQKADVVIIGAGITGAMTAVELTELGLSVILLDRHRPVRGSTFASTALLQYELDTPLIKLKRKIGTDNAFQAWRRSKLGIESLAAKIQACNIACDFSRKDTLYLAGNVLDPEQLRDEHAARNLIGLETSYLAQKELKTTYGISRKAALHSYGSMTVNPVRLAAGLLKTAIINGAKIFSPVTATDIHPGRSGVIVETDNGPSIAAKYVIFAGGYEFPKQMRSKYHKVHSTYAIATKPQPGKLWPDKLLIWEASDPYLYMRTTPDGRIICGGEDEAFSNTEKRDALLARKTATLQRKLGKMFPNIDPVADYAWTGSFGSSTTGLPLIGPVPGMNNCFAIMAFGGNGITFSRIAAEIIRAKLAGKQDPDEKLFQFKS